MTKTVLLVDDDQEMLLALKGGFSRYRDSFGIQLAAGGLQAVEKLKQSVISLVVTDLKMPGMDGFELLAHIMEHYPDIPVIIMTGYSAPEMERLAREGGAVGYIAKPFLIENLTRQIIARLRKESEGGTLHNVSCGMFLQLVEMEQKTCIIRLEDKLTEKKGILFFQDGKLLDARVDDLQGENAVYQIFSWDQVNLSIQNGCALKKKQIHRELQHIILEAARRKDEDIAEAPPPSVPEAVDPFDVDPNAYLKSIKEKIEKRVGSGCGLEDIYQADAWNGLILQLARIGEYFSLGELMMGYIDKGERTDYIVLPGEKTTVISVNPQCPRDRLLEVLGD